MLETCYEIIITFRTFGFGLIGFFRPSILADIRFDSHTMNLTSYILDQALKQLKLPPSSLMQFKIAASLSDVGGNGFPKELFQLSAPLVVRGLLNFATLQMNRNWVYPYWVHRQLNPHDVSFIPRSQNPLLLNVTHRNWTALGSPHGVHEAIIDPRGLATPLPREWSLDVWLQVGERVLFPSLVESCTQQIDCNAPRLTTIFSTEEVELTIEQFVDSTNRNIDVLFQRAQVRNIRVEEVSGFLCIAVRPFNPEGVAPIHSIEVHHNRFLYLDGVLGVALAKSPELILLSNGEQGDTALQLPLGSLLPDDQSKGSIECTHGLANALAVYRFELGPEQQFNIDCSTALGFEQQLRNGTSKQSWRVSFDRRKSRHTGTWERELATGADFQIPDEDLQKVFDASRLALLQLQEAEFISPGPYLYHHFWFRDAAPMVRALDLLGFKSRTREVIDGFRSRHTAEGFFRGPEGEWDSNGAVLWSVYRHYLLTRSRAWLEGWYPSLLKGARWIRRARNNAAKDRASVSGLMPPGLSAEHLGTVDQYFWDSFWSLAGISAFVSSAEVLKRSLDQEEFATELLSFNQDILSAIIDCEKRLGHPLIPASPRRGFDESAIGSIVALYPLEILGRLPHAANTVSEIDRRYTDSKGFFHPIIHSGYNPYLTLQLAECHFFLGNVQRSWELADCVLRQMRPPYSLPEAIHPGSGGGSMGDGHHGWAAAEIVLLLRNYLVKEKEGILSIFGGCSDRLVSKGKNTTIRNAPTDFGSVTATLEFEAENRCMLKFENRFFDDNRPRAIEVTLPFAVSAVTASTPNEVLATERCESSTLIRCASSVRTLFIEL